jgi:hypothetical protein
MHWPVASHAVAQAPQLVASVSGFLQRPSQQEKPPGQVALSTQLGTHAAPSHFVPGVQSTSVVHPLHS